MKRTSLTVSRASFGWLFMLLPFSLVGCGGAEPLDPTGPEAEYGPPALLGPSSKALEVKAVFVASLSGEDAGTESSGVGEAVFHFGRTDESVQFRLNVANLQNVTMAHIHIAAEPGGNGPPAVWLYPDGPPPQLISGRTQGVLATGSFSSEAFVGPLAGMTLAELRGAIVEGRAYVNVHTLQHPGGEIRGTIG